MVNTSVIYSFTPPNLMNYKTDYFIKIEKIFDKIKSEMYNDVAPRQVVKSEAGELTLMDMGDKCNNLNSCKHHH